MELFKISPVDKEETLLLARIYSFLLKRAHRRAIAQPATKPVALFDAESLTTATLEMPRPTNGPLLEPLMDSSTPTHD